MSRCSFAAANLFFASAILVNSLLIFFIASAVSMPVVMLPFNAAVSCCAAEIAFDLGDKVGFVMYWC